MLTAFNDEEEEDHDHLEIQVHHKANIATGLIGDYEFEARRRLSTIGTTGARYLNFEPAADLAGHKSTQISQNIYLLCTGLWVLLAALLTVDHQASQIGNTFSVGTIYDIIIEEHTQHNNSLQLNYQVLDKN